MSAAAIVRARGLCRAFGAVQAVRDVDFTVAPGELFGIVGPDGAGKTTLMRMLAGVLRPSGGDAEIDGHSVVRDPEAVKRATAYMPQRFGLYADLSVMENLAFYADLYQVPRAERAARIARLFEFSDLGRFKERRAGALSGGMKQKLALSCALIHQPKVLLLDEPTFGVDPVSRRDLWLIVHERVAQGTTAVASTAYLDEAERFDRVAFLHEGAVLALDTPDALRRAYPHAVWVVEATPARRAREWLARDARVRAVNLYGDRLHVAMDAGTEPAALAALLADAGVDVAGVRAATPSLEDAFIAAMRGAEARAA